MYQQSAQYQQAHGFSLIELLIVITIGAVVLGVGVSRFTTFNRTQGIKSAGLYLKNNLRLIQTTTSIEVSGDCPLDESLLGHEVSIGYNTSNYTVTPLCSGGLSTNSKQYLLPAGYQFSRYQGGDVANFQILGLGAGLNVDQVRIGIMSTTGSYYYALCMSKGGDIDDCGYSQGSWPTCNCP